MADGFMFDSLLDEDEEKQTYSPSTPSQDNFMFNDLDDTSVPEVEQPKNQMLPELQPLDSSVTMSDFDIPVPKYDINTPPPPKNTALGEPVDAPEPDLEATETGPTLQERFQSLYEREHKERQAGSLRNIDAEAKEKVDFTSGLMRTAIERYGYTEEEAIAAIEASGAEAADRRLTTNYDIAVSDVREDIDNDLDVDLDKLMNRLNSENFVTSGLSERLLVAAEEGHLTLNQVNAIVFADEVLNPVTAVVGVPILFRDAAENIREGNYLSAVADITIGTIDALPALKVGSLATKGVNKVWAEASGGVSAYEKVQEAMKIESKLAEEINKTNYRVAMKNRDVRNRLISEWEDRNPKYKISKLGEDGNLELDTDLIREQGTTRVTEYYIDDVYHGTTGKDAATPLEDLMIGEDASLAIPMLNPDKLNALVSVAVDLQKAYPEAFKGKEPLIDQLFNLSVMKPKGSGAETIFETPEMLQILTRAGMSYEEYVLGVVGSGSQAGRFLNRLSQMKRVKPRSIKEQQADKSRQAVAKGLSRFWTGTVLRTENIRRGLMVSSLATAARNYQSAIVRSPMESMANVFDTAMLTYARAVETGESSASALSKSVKNINPLVRDGTYKGAFRNMRYMYFNQKEAEEWSNYILNRPELADQLTKMQNNVLELQELTGRGKATTTVGKGLDKVASGLEDFTSTLNTPNRWQEHVIRRATFLSELERLTQAEWGIDLRKALEDGAIQQVLNDSPRFRPEKGRTFVDIMEEATQKALDVTYAKQPDFPPFKFTSDLITKSGLTVIVPFPRFMFNSLEYMAQSTGGAALPLIRRAAFKDARGTGLTARDRQDISRNLAGAAAITAFYQYRNSDDAPEAYETMRYGDDAVDITPVYPMRQMAWIAEFERRRREGTLDTWYGMDMDHIAETWLGTTARTGMGNIFVEEVRDIIVSSGDEVDAQARAKKIGGAVGQYAMTYFTPYFQVVEAQRAMDLRPDYYADAATDPEFKGSAGEAFKSGFMRSAVQRGMASPSFESELPARVSITTGEIDRFDSAIKLFFGINKKDMPDEMTEYLTSIGFDDPTYDLGSKSRIPSEKRAENWYLSAVLPMAVEIGKQVAESEGANKREQNVLARNYIKNIMQDGKNDFVNEGIGSPMAKAVDKLSRMPSDQRKAAVVRFRLYNDREPDLSSISDLQQLMEFSQSITK